MALDYWLPQGENFTLPEPARGWAQQVMDEPTDATSTYGPDVMVSYSSHDRPQVMQFVQRLRAAGVAAWIDQGGIDGAQKWGEEIVNAIDSCKTVILMISQNSMQSENINREVMLAWENGKHFLPLCLDEAKIPKSMQYQLAGIQKINLFEGDPEAKFVAVLRALVRLDVHVSPYYIALVSADLGDRDQALEWLNKAVEQRAGGLSRLKTEARFNGLRGDPRFAQIVARAESLPLEPEIAVPAAPAFPAGPVVVLTAPAKPSTWWKQILWPDIVNDSTARQASAQGVWAAAFLIVASIFGLMFASSAAPVPGAASGPAFGLTTVILIAIVFGAVGFGVQKMGRPAAVIGLVLCASGALQNLTNLQNASAPYNYWSAQYRQYEAYVQQYPQLDQPRNPTVLAYEQASSTYYGSWMALLISLLCVGGFTNATRGTFGYRRLVMSRMAVDKQEALTKEDIAAIKAKITGWFGKSRAAAAPPIARPAPAPVRVAPPPVPQYNASATATVPAPALPLVPRPVSPAPAVEVTPQAVPEAPPVPAPAVASAPAPALLRQGFAATIGVSGGIVYWPRVGAFLLANVAAGLTFLIGRSMSTSFSVPPIYWLFVICVACVFTAATVAGFHFLANVWAAAAVAAGLATLGSLPLLASLPTFAWSDLFYREQFQQFVLLPFVNSFILLIVLVWVVPRLQPMVLALWLGAMGTEIATSMVANLLHAAGAKDLPDTVLGGASVISAVLRSLAFAVVLWAGLQYVRKQSAVAAG